MRHNSQQDVALLVEPDDRLRAVPLPLGIHTVIERCHVSPGRTEERVWRHRQGERALTGQRVFREDIPPAPPEAPEQPRYDELVVRFPDDTRPPPGSGTRGWWRRGLLALRRGGRLR